MKVNTNSDSKGTSELDWEIGLSLINSQRLKSASHFRKTTPSHMLNRVLSKKNR